MKKNRLLLGTAICCSLLGFDLQAKEIDTNVAQMQAMDKITGKVSLIEVPVNGDVKFGSFSIVIRACKTRPPEETPENFAFVDVVDNYSGENPVNIFRGWMMSSTPALNPIEHPIYDVWLLKCVDGAVDKSKLLKSEELKARDAVAKAPSVEEKEEKAKSEEETVIEKIVVSDAKDKENPANDATQELEQLKAEPVQQDMAIPDAQLSAPSVSNPSSLVEIDANVDTQEAQVQEDGAPKSLLNISNSSAQSQENVTPNENDAPLVANPENPAPVAMVDDLIVNQEIAPESASIKEEVVIAAPEAVAPIESNIENNTLQEISGVEAPAPLLSPANENLAPEANQILEPSQTQPEAPQDGGSQLIEFEEVEEEPLDINTDALTAE